MSASALEFSVELPAAPERVFAALTEGPALKRWFCDACESEPRANGRLVMRWTRPRGGASGMDERAGAGGSEPFVARWVEFTPPARAAFHGGNADYPSGDAGTVWFSLLKVGAGTRLDVRHEWPARKEYAALAQSWRSAWPRALERLASVLAPPPERRA